MWHLYQHLQTWERETRRTGLSKTHGLRHACAQRRYEDLTTRKAPVLGSASSKELPAELKDQDRSARLQIATELGHSRIDITNI